MRSCPDTYYLVVVEDTELEKIVACGTLLVEQKFIHRIALVCIFTFSLSFKKLDMESALGGQGGFN